MSRRKSLLEALDDIIENDLTNDSSDFDSDGTEENNYIPVQQVSLISNESQG